MMAQEQSQGEQFFSLLQHISDLDHREEDALSKIRFKAWDHFQELGLPSRQKEVYQYIRLRQLYAEEFSKPVESSIDLSEIRNLVLDECQHSFITLINGFYSKELSCTSGVPSKLVVCDLTQAARTYSAFLNNHWAKLMKEESDPFAALNAAMHGKGLFIYAPPETLVDVPLQIIHVIDPKGVRPWISPRVQIFASKNSALTLISTVKTWSADSYAINQVTDVSLDDNAQVQLTHIATDQPETSWHFDAIRASLKRNSRFQAINLNDGAYSYRNDYHINLVQEGAEAELDGISLLHTKREAHTNVYMNHQAPHCRSRQLFKTVLQDVSKSSFEGKIFVHQEAQKTDAFQLNNNLLLSERAHADSKPNLEIFADDVKASHGATVGCLNEEQLFYLKSRGFEDKVAKNLLILGYGKEIIDRIKLRSLEESLIHKVENYIG